MADKTTNYNLTKPSADDFYNVEVQNGNMDIIDAELKNLNDGKAPSGHGLGTFPKPYAGSQINLIKEVLRYGSGFYQVDSADDNPMDNSSWKPMLQLALSDESGVQLLMPYLKTDGDVWIPTPQMMLRSIVQNVPSDWFEMLHTGNISKHTPKVATGTYVGTGTCGSANPNIITFESDFVPQIIFVRESNFGIYNRTRWMHPLIRGCNNSHSEQLGVEAYLERNLTNIDVIWGNNYVSWYTDTRGEDAQLNQSRVTYSYVAIG